MSLELEILADFRQLLAEHGVGARWKTIDLRVLVSLDPARAQTMLDHLIAYLRATYLPVPAKARPQP